MKSKMMKTKNKFKPNLRQYNFKIAISFNYKMRFRIESQQLKQTKTFFKSCKEV